MPTIQEEATLMPTSQTAQDSVVYTLAFGVNLLVVGRVGFYSYRGCDVNNFTILLSTSGSTVNLVVNIYVL
jgi:hypothetical protein